MDEFKYKDRIKIESSESSEPDIHFLDGMVGIYLRKANDEESVVILSYEEYETTLTMTVNNKYIKLLSNEEIEEETIKKDLKEDIKKYNQEKDREENFIPKLQEFLGIDDGVKFYLDNDLKSKCYFENGKFILIEKNTNKVIEDDNLRNKLLYGLITGTNKPIVGRLTSIPKHGFKYYYWETAYHYNRSMLKSSIRAAINYVYWNESIEDYTRFCVGNCFPTWEACKKNYSIIERIKNKALKELSEY